MSRELTNLLSGARIRGFRKRYFLRLATVGITLLALVVLLHGILLLPSYLYAREEVVRGREQLALLNAASQSSEEQEVMLRTTLLKETVQYLERLERAPTASAALRAVLTVPRSGVAITGFTFTAPPAGSATARLSITGVANSRDSLRAYAAALGSLPFVTSADLPISAYAKERDIAFTITLSGPMRP